MTAMQRATYQWMAGAELDGLPEGITLTPYMPESGRAVARRVGTVHAVQSAALIEDANDARLIAAWYCGGSSTDAMEVANDTDPLCASCQLALRLPNCPCVYRAWDEDGTLLYIGSTINPPQRMRAHATGTQWWHRVARVTFEEYETESEVRKAESAAIWNEPTIYNRGGTRKDSTAGLLNSIAIETSKGAPA